MKGTAKGAPETLRKAHLGNRTRNETKQPPESLIQREIKQTRPFPSRHQECLIGLLRTSDLVRRFLSGVVERFGVTGQQYNVLRILRGSGPRGLPTLEIGERMVERAPGITRLLDRLEVKELVSRARCPDDRRVVFCSITPRGLSLLREMDTPILDADRQSLGGIEARDATKLIRLLDAIRAGHRTAPPPEPPARQANRRHTRHRS